MSSPSIVFFDEADALMVPRTDGQSEGARDITSLLMTILSEMTVTGQEVVTIATTARPHAIDSAFLRHFPECIYVPLPDVAAIFNIIQTQLQKYRRDPFLDTPEGRRKLDLLAGTCMKSGNKKRYLSGDDIVRAMKLVREEKRRELFRADYFEEVSKPHSHSSYIIDIVPAYSSRWTNNLVPLCAKRRCY